MSQLGLPPTRSAPRSRRHDARRGQSLVEFALVALVMYLLLAAILTFGHALYVAQGLQQAADFAAREIARTPLPADITLDNPPDHPEPGALHHDRVRSQIFDEAYLVIDLEEFFAGGGENFFHDEDGMRSMPLLNQQLAPLMILDDRSVPDRRLLRYPGALLTRTTPLSPPSNSLPYRSWVAAEFTVGVPLIEDHRGQYGEATEVRWIPIIEEINSEEIDSDANSSPFQISSDERGIVALRINYPFQSAAMSSFRENRDEPFAPTIGFPHAADDGAVMEHGRVDEITGGNPVRPFRRVISGQAIYRREVFLE